MKPSRDTDIIRMIFLGTVSSVQAYSFQAYEDHCGASPATARARAWPVIGRRSPIPNVDMLPTCTDKVALE
jgi:hypothetical protein